MNADLTVVFRPSVGNLVLRQVNGVGLVAEFEFFYLAVFNGQQMVDGFGKLGNDNGLVQKKRIIGKIFRFAVVYLIAAKTMGTSVPSARSMWESSIASQPSSVISIKIAS